MTQEEIREVSKMRGILIISLNVMLSACLVQASTGGPMRLKPIRLQMVENNMTLERISNNQVSFAKQDFEGDLGEIYEVNTKSPFKAFILSLAVPGLGELYLGHKLRAASFFAADVALWSGYLIYHGKGSDKEKEYKGFAQQHYLWSTYQQWWDAIPDSIKETYSHRLPVDDAGNPIFNHEYYENIGKYDQFQVGWDDIGLNFPPPPLGESFVSANRTFYLNLRKKSNDYFTTASTIAMVSIANHIISAFDAAILAKKYNRGARNYSLEFKSKRFDGEMTPFLEFTAKF
jgi:hypothetical protein